jgi:SAM-dependent methyltransferase/aminoglycoside phosphotransferase (APT) family kinase protein
MRELVADAQRVGWRSALNQLLEHTRYPETLLHYVIGRSRGGWWPLLDLGETSRVLDLGCGWGAVSVTLAPFVAEVVACDPTVERLRFLQLRADDEGLKNIRPLWAGDSPQLPFGDASFDTVIMNGVLEWLPPMREGRPIDVQRAALADVARILRPDGQLLLAIENRWSGLYFRGKPEDHVKLRFVSLLPRPLANAYARLALGRPYRTHTHSYRAYRQLLSAAGFSGSRGLIPLPDYRFFDAVLDPCRPSTVRRYFTSRGVTAFEHAGSSTVGAVARAFAPSFCWIADHGVSRPSFLDRFARMLAASLGLTEPAHASWSAYRVTPRNVIAVELEMDHADGSFFVKFPLDRHAASRCQREYDTLLSISRDVPATARFPYIPVPRATGQFMGARYFVQSLCSGYAGTRFLRSTRWPKACLGPAMAFLTELHSATAQRTIIDNRLWTRRIADAFQPGIQSAAAHLNIDASSIEDALRAYFIGRPWPLVLNHGDYWAGNLIFDSTGTDLRGVVDWDSSLHGFLPLFDALNLVLFSRAERERRPLPDVIADALINSPTRESDLILLDYCKRLGLELDPRDWPILGVAYWLLYVGARVSVRRNDERWVKTWLDDNVVRARSWVRGVVV